MAGQWREAAFRPAAVTDPQRPARRQSVALLAVLALVVGAVAAVSALVRPDDARTFDLFRGSVFLADSVAPVAVDLATGRPTVRLVDAATLVGATRAADVGVVPSGDTTLLVNGVTGEFNVVDATGFVVKKDGGVPLPGRAARGTTAAVGVAAADLDYVVRTGDTGTSVYLVGPATVQGAVGGGRVQPRAFRTMTEPGSTAPGATATAGNDLYLLVGAGPQRVVRRLHLPAESPPGVRLASTDLAGVTGPAALAASGGAVGVLGGGRLVVVHGARTVLSRALPVAGLDRVLPAGGSTGRLAWLVHGTAGWSVVSVSPDGTGVLGPVAVHGLAADAQPVPPVENRGALWTVDGDDGRLLRITADGTATTVGGIASYPLATQAGRPIETGGFSDTRLLSRGPRVVVNSPTHLLAVVVATDGDRPPTVVEKGAAVAVSGAGGAAALAQARAREPARTTTQKPTTKPPASARPVTPITNRIDCRTTSQKPHIPTFLPPTPGSRSVLVQWTYPVTNQTDCVPTTYVVGVRTLSGAAPAGPSSVTVQGQQALNLVGLFPSTAYELTVTAYLNGRGTSSAPIRVTTGPEGPAAPRDLAVAATSDGAWRVTWSSCGTVRDGCVPSVSWRVVTQYCDGGTLAGTPPTLDVAADPTTTVQPGATVPASPSLLGRGLRVQVLGVGADGSLGTPAVSDTCVRSWAPPRAGAMRLSASSPADVAAGTTTTATVALDLGPDPVLSAGGVGAQVTLSLDGPGGVRTRTLTVDGRTSTLTADFDGVRPGATYTASATVSPPGHPESAVDLGPTSTTTRSRWPDLSVTAGCPSSGLLTCDLTVRIGGVSSAGSGGETFDLAGGSVLRCGNVALDLSQARFDPATTAVTVSGISQLGDFFGRCTVTVGLVESQGQGAPLWYGGTPSPSASTDVDLGSPTEAGLTAGDFTAAWAAVNGSSAQVRYTGDKDLDALTRNWHETLHAPDGTECGTAADRPGTTDDTAASVPAGDCVQRFGDQPTGWTVEVRYDERTTGTTHTLTVPLDGAPPSYQACVPGTPTAQWGPTRADGVTVGLDGDLDGCRDWVATLLTPDGTACGTASGTPQPTLVPDCGDPAAPGWTVTLTYTRPDGASASLGPVAVTGDPPTG